MKFTIHDTQLKRILLILLGSCILGVAVSNLYIFPLFTKMVLIDSEGDAITIGKHLTTMVLPEGHQDLANHLPEGTHRLEKLAKEFSLYKLKVFDPDGLTIFSTDKKDIGVRNEHDYFQSEVANGRSVTKSVRKKTRSLEDQLIRVDVIETYVPVIHGGAFVGALEIYLDITDQLKIVDKVVMFSNMLSIGFALAFLMVILVVVRQLDTNIAEQKNARNFLKMTNIDLKNEIENRIQAEKEKEAVIVELEETLLKINVLKGLVPICSFCKNIRNDAGFWERMETYVEKHSDAEFSHGMCPDCAAKQYPDLHLNDDDETYEKKLAEKRQREKNNNASEG